MTEETVETTEDLPVETGESTPADQGSEEVDIQEEAATSDSDESDPAEKPKKGGFQKRIDELTRQRYEEQQARQEAEQRLAEYEKRLTELQTTQQMSQYDATKPTLEQFDYDHEAYENAYQEWVKTGIEREREAQTAAQKQAEEYQAKLNKQAEIQRKMAQAQEQYPDFMVKVNDPSLPSLAQINPAAYDALIESDQLGEVSYYLANNPSKVYEFSSMSPVQAVKEIARLEDKLSAKAKSVTQAPEPATSVKGKTEAVKDPQKMTTEEWMAWRKQSMR